MGEKRMRVREVALLIACVACGLAEEFLSDEGEIGAIDTGPAISLGIPVDAAVTMIQASEGEGEGAKSTAGRSQDMFAVLAHKMHHSEASGRKQAIERMNKRVAA